MTLKNDRMPRSTMNRVLHRAVKQLDAMSVPERIQIMVKAKLMTQDEADAAVQRLTQTGSVKNS